MRFIRLSVGAMLILTAATASAQQPWAEKMFKDGVVHDFGSVPRGGQLFHRFKITNIYAEQMQITELRSGCGCVSASAAKRVLEPREEAFVEVNMDSRLFTGLKSVKVFVSVGPRFVSTAELRVSANSRADIVCNPTHIGFGTVAAGSRPTQTIDIEYAGVLDWKVTELVSKDVPVEATLKELYRRPGQVGYRLEAKLDADAPPGTIKRELFLKTNDPTTPLVPVLVEATVAGHAPGAAERAQRQRRARRRGPDQGCFRAGDSALHGSGGRRPRQRHYPCFGVRQRAGPGPHLEVQGAAE